MLEESVEAIRLALAKASKIIVIAHVNPDGDAVSSLTSTGLALEQLGKDFSLVCDDGLPERFLFLPLSDRIQSEPDSRNDYDLIIALDSGDTNRLGKAFRALTEPRGPVINIDHHITNTQYGQVNLVDPSACSTTEILYRLFQQLDIELTEPLAINLLTGLVTDTLSFSTANVSARTLSIAGALVDAGADLYSVTNQALSLKPLSTLLIWQKGLNNLRVEDGLLWTSINNQERREAGHEGSSSFGLANLLSDVYQAVMSAVLLEMDDGRVSVGFRCRPPFKVSELAQSLGGGGHHLAAGCTLTGSLSEVETLVISQCRKTIAQQKAALV